MIDGTANIDTSLGTPAAVLSVDAIQEFKEQTTTYSAEYGFSSNQINLVSKTGTNALHGTGFGFFRNDAWDARNFFDDKTAPAPQLDQKQFGFVAGGPVMLPGYDGRNRTFFLVNYEGTRIDRGATNFYTVPTPEELTGRFSTTIIDPLTGHAVSEQHHSAVAILAARAAGHPEQLVPGTEQLGRAGQLPGRANVSAGPGPVHDSRPIRIWPSSAACSSAIRTPPTRTRPPRISSRLVTGCSCRTPRTGRSPTAGPFGTRSSTSSGSAVSTRAPTSTASRAPRQTWTSSMYTGVFTGIPDDQRECPSIAMNGYAGTGGAVNAYTASNQPMWDISNTTTWVKGQHTLNFGVNYRRWWLQRDLATGFLGNLRLQRRVHRQSWSPTCCSGTTRASASSNRRRSACREQPATRASSTSSTSRRTSRTTGASARN